MIFRIIEVDEFIAELWKVHLKVKEEDYVQVSRSARYSYLHLITLLGSLIGPLQI